MIKSSSKILSQSRLTTKVKNAKAQKKMVVFTNGCFDILHVGHIKYLEKAKSLGDILIVGVNSDSSVKKIKGPNRPINSQSDRAGVLSGLSSVDFITIFSETTPERLIKRLNPDILVKGADWKKSDIVGAAYLKQRGGRIVRVPMIKGRSTTSIIGKISKR